MLTRFFSRADAGAAEDPAPEPFSFPEPLPTWPQGGGFARGRIRVAGGELELAAATAFDKICTLSPSARLQRCDGATFYRPAGLTRPTSASPGKAFAVRGLRPLCRGMREKGIGAGTFWCAAADGCSSPAPSEQGLACLKNVDLDLSAMPTLEQVHAVIQHYGPTLYFHPKEVYLPSSVAWYFKNGAKLFKKGGGAVGEEIDAEGSNLPGGGWNDGEYWMDIPDGKRRQAILRGDIESAELYAHVKPAMGGACTDVAMWVFCPFNGPARLKLGPINLPLGTTGQHVGDWEHFTLRVSNFTGELMAVYYSQHSGGRWVDAAKLEYAAGNRPAVGLSRNGHASYPRAGVYLQGSAALGVGILNEAARSKLSVDSSVRSRTGTERMVKSMPQRLSCPAENMLNKMPNELSKEEGPTGPKEKNMWEGDERW
uniref:Uncharacterized protein n=1 Tax=Aegilops tauschii TaxID=37682 RepID=M8AXQ3_AEGTA